ncbi:hypothetical protein TDIS_0455 [Thermosulfurimonas dismutans]|uniref:Uncharacterized protein n=1 Tax=Thermosulfurimonas dismutans TaxID=999894 RepID=A0A179D571_9BACT|nr:hypothetical protein TDIS_0455 [Thermosulfurimonas dismutans]
MFIGIKELNKTILPRRLSPGAKWNFSAKVWFYLKPEGMTIRRF